VGWSRNWKESTFKGGGGSGGQRGTQPLVPGGLKESPEAATEKEGNSEQGRRGTNERKFRDERGGVKRRQGGVLGELLETREGVRKQREKVAELLPRGGGKKAPGRSLKNMKGVVFGHNGPYLSLGNPGKGALFEDQTAGNWVGLGRCLQKRGEYSKGGDNRSSWTVFERGSKKNGKRGRTGKNPRSKREKLSLSLIEGKKSNQRCVVRKGGKRTSCQDQTQGDTETTNCF